MPDDRETDEETIRRIAMAEALEHLRREEVGTAPQYLTTGTTWKEIRNAIVHGYELNEAQTSAFTRAAIEWLQGKWGEERACPYCGVVHWEVGTPLLIEAVEERQLSPQFPVMCGNCGQTTFINAIRAGLWPEVTE